MENKETEAGQQMSNARPQKILQEEIIIKQATQLENEKDHVQKQSHAASKLSASPLPVQSNWYIIVIFLEIITAIAVFTISDSSYPLVYIRYGLGLVFLFFLPGFTLTKAVFPAKNSTTSSEDMFSTGRVALSIGLSIVLTILIGFILYYTPWGISLTSIVPTVIILTIVFATVAVYREQRML